MAAPATTDEFLELIRKSGVADDKRLDVWLQIAKSNGSLPIKPGEAAALLIRDSILTKFQAEQILQGKWRRFTIGKYKVLESLGSGGMGSVYLCEHKLMRRRVAVKVLPTAKAQDESALQRFYREARAVAALDHPNIVHAYDIDQDDTLHFLVMEYVDGASLQEIVKKSGPMDITRSCHYIRQATLGLEHAHDAGLIHRDIKPGNILVDRTGVVKILDMGLARFFNDDDDMLTRKFDENVLGTADYLAPEQAIDSHTVDVRADIYSLGATFYFMLTGRTPFGDGTVAQKLLWHQNRQPKPVTEFRTEVPPALAAVIAKMMAKELGQRYQTPAEVAQALEPYTQEAIGPPPDVEMPHLSPAAVGPSNAAEHMDTAIVKTSAPTVPKALQGMSAKQKMSGAATAPRTPAPSAPSKPTAAPARVPAAGAPPPAPKPRAAAPPPPTKPAPAPPPRAAQTVTEPEPEPVAVEEEAPWESLASVDTEDPSAKGDTAPQGAKSARPLSRTAAVKNPRRAWLIFSLIGGGALLIIVGVIIYYAVTTQPVPVAPVRRPLDVSKDAVSGASYRSILQALRAAQPGDVIQLHDAEHVESLRIELPRMQGEITTDVTIQVAPGKEVVWKPHRKEEDVPILLLQNARNFKIIGDGLTIDGAIDGKKRVKDLVVINYESPSLTIAAATFRNFSRSAIHIVNAGGMKGRPMRLLNLKTAGAGAEKPLAAIVFEAGVGSTPAQNEFIEVSGFEFPDILATKEIGNAPNGRDVKVRK